jgi:hypothetical protein
MRYVVWLFVWLIVFSLFVASAALVYPLLAD